CYFDNCLCIIMSWQNRGKVQAMAIEQGETLWSPTAGQVEETRLAQFMEYVAQRHGKRFEDYESLWQWSVDEVETFWGTVLQCFQVEADGHPAIVLADSRMPGAKWFPGLRLNYAEHVCRNADPSRP